MLGSQGGFLAKRVPVKMRLTIASRFERSGKDMRVWVSRADSRARLTGGMEAKDPGHEAKIQGLPLKIYQGHRNTREKKGSPVRL